MRTIKRTIGYFLCVLALAGVAAAQGAKTAKPGAPPPPPPPAHVLTAPADIVWGPAPPILEPGASFAVIAGDPGKPGIYVVRIKMPAGYRIAPHWHPTDEHVTVISGSFAFGMGDKFEKASMKTLPAGGYGLMPAEMRHYAVATDAAVVQVHGIGPFALNYVNPADDPSKRAAAKPAK